MDNPLEHLPHLLKACKHLVAQAEETPNEITNEMYATIIAIRDNANAIFGEIAPYKKGDESPLPD